MSEHDIIFTGKVKAGTTYVGTHSQPRKRKDKFGILHAGQERQFLIDTPYGQLHLDSKYGNKKISIFIEF